MTDDRDEELEEAPRSRGTGSTPPAVVPVQPMLFHQPPQGPQSPQQVNQFAVQLASHAPPNVLDRVTSEHIATELELKKQINANWHQAELKKIDHEEERDKRQHNRDSSADNHQHSMQTWALRAAIGIVGVIVIAGLVLLLQGEYEKAMDLLKLVMTHMFAFVGGAGAKSFFDKQKSGKRSKDDEED